MPRSSAPAWLAHPHAVDTVVAVLRDRADDDEKHAAAVGMSRTAQAGVRTLRHYAHQLADHGTPGAQLDPIPGARQDGPHEGGEHQ